MDHEHRGTSEGEISSGSPTVEYSPTRAGGTDDDGEEVVSLPADDPRAFVADEGGGLNCHRTED